MTRAKDNKRLYKVWGEMKRRCNNPNDKVFAHYGGRGISYAPEWERFTPFCEWALKNGYDANAKRGECTLDRIDNDGNYTPENCRWVNQNKQANNKKGNIMLECNGETHTLSEWARIKGINVETIRKRLCEYGYTVEDALKVPVRDRQRKYIEYNGIRDTARGWAARLGLSKSVVSERIKHGWPIEEAVTTLRSKRGERGNNVILTAKNAVDFAGEWRP